MHRLTHALAAIVALVGQAGPATSPDPPHRLGTFASGCGEFERLEAVAGPDGTTEVRFEGQVFRVHPPGAPRAVEWVQAFTVLMPLDHRPKWQNGRAWFKSGNRVGEVDPATRSTRYPFALDGSFETFDITFEGDLLLTGTGRNWLELHAPGRAEPRFTQERAPMDGLGVHPGLRWMDWDRKGVWSTAVLQQFVILMDHDLGRVFAFDARSHTLTAIEVPWRSPMTLEDPPIGRLKGAGARYVLNQGVPGPNCIQFVPKATGELGVVWRVAPVAESLRRDHDPENLAKLLAIPTGTWEATLDLEAHRIRDIRPLEGVDLPAWFDGARQQWVAARAFFAPHLPKPDKAPAKRKGSTDRTR